MDIRLRLDEVMDADFLAVFEKFLQAGRSHTDAFRFALLYIMRESERNGMRFVLNNQPQPVTNNYAPVTRQDVKPPPNGAGLLDVDFSDIEI